MSLREERCNKVCRILDDVLANRPTERDSLILAVRKAFAQPKKGKWIDRGEHGDWEWQADGRGKHWHEWECNTCHHYYAERSFFCPHCGADMREVTT